MPTLKRARANWTPSPDPVFAACSGVRIDLVHAGPSATSFSVDLGKSSAKHHGSSTVLIIDASVAVRWKAATPSDSGTATVTSFSTLSLPVSTEHGYGRQRALAGHAHAGIC